MKLSDFIGEATEYDKKEMLEERKPKSWLKSVSAFANGIGGVLFFGVSNDEILVGLDDAKSVSEKISEAIKAKMDPAPQVILEIHTEDGKEFVVLRVPSGQETPYYYTGDGNRIASCPFPVPHHRWSLYTGCPSFLNIGFHFLPPAYIP